MRAWASRYVSLVVERCHGNKRDACRVLGISYHTLRAYLKYPVHDPPSDDDVSWPPDEQADDAPGEEAVPPCVVAGVREE